MFCLTIISSVMAYNVGDTVEMMFNATPNDFCGYTNTDNQYVFTSLFVLNPSGEFEYDHYPRATFNDNFYFNINFTLTQPGTYTACFQVLGIIQDMQTCDVGFLDCMYIACKNYTVSSCPPPTFFRPEINAAYDTFKEYWYLYSPIHWL